MSGPDPSGATADARVLADLRALGRPATAEEVAARLAIPANTARRALGKLVRDRLVRKAGGGLWAVAARPPRR